MLPQNGDPARLIHRFGFRINLRIRAQSWRTPPALPHYAPHYADPAPRMAHANGQAHRVPCSDPGPRIARQ